MTSNLATGPSADSVSSLSVSELRELLVVALVDFDHTLAYKLALCLRLIPSKLPIRGDQQFIDAFTTMPAFADNLRWTLLSTPGIGWLWTLTFLDLPNLHSFISKLSLSQIEEFNEDPSLTAFSIVLQPNMSDNYQLLDDAVRLAGYTAYPFFLARFRELIFPEDDWIEAFYFPVDDIWSILAASARYTTLIILATAIGYPPLGPRTWFPRATLALVIQRAASDPVKEQQMIHVLSSIYNPNPISTFTILRLDEDCRVSGCFSDSTFITQRRLAVDTSDPAVVTSFERHPPALWFLFASLTYLYSTASPSAPTSPPLSISLPSSAPKRPLSSSSSSSAAPSSDTFDLVKTLLYRLTLNALQVVSLHVKAKGPRKKKSRADYITAILITL